MTPPDITANLFSILNVHRYHIIITLQFEENAVEGKDVADFCSGTGMYLIAAAYFKPHSLTGFELDPDAYAIAQSNLEGADVQADLKLYDLLKITDDLEMQGKFDTVVMNPPFGTKNNEGIDMQLLSAAIYVRIKYFILYRLVKAVYTVCIRSLRADI